MTPKLLVSFSITTKYKKKNEINILMSGGTNSLSAKLAKQNDVKFQGVSIGTFARKIIKEYIELPDFVPSAIVLPLSASCVDRIISARLHPAALQGVNHGNQISLGHCRCQH